MISSLLGSVDTLVFTEMQGGLWGEVCTSFEKNIQESFDMDAKTLVHLQDAFTFKNKRFKKFLTKNHHLWLSKESFKQLFFKRTYKLVSATE